MLRPLPRPPAPEVDTTPRALALLSEALAADSAALDAAGRFPHEHFERLQQAGLLGLAVATSDGGAGAGLLRCRRVIEAVARGEPATALILTMQFLQTRALSAPGCRWPAALRRRVLAEVLHEGALLNALRVEPALGSPARGGLPATTLRGQPDGSWRLDGHKLYSTGVEGLRWLVVWARTDETPPRVGSVLVPAGAPGVSVLRTWDALGLRASGSHDVRFADVALPAEHAVDLRPPEDWAGAIEPDMQAWMAVLLGSLYDAIAQNARDWIAGFLRERAPTSIGASLATLPRAQEALGEIELLLQANRVQLDAAAAAADAGEAWSAVQSGLLKAGTTRAAIEVVERALKLSGNHGISRANSLERYHRDVLCGRIHTPQDDSACIAAGRAVLQATA